MKVLYRTFRFLFLAALLVPSSHVLGAAQSTCNANQNWNAGAYRVMTNYWNQATCPGTQCVTMDDVSGNFGVTQMTANCTSVASYPAIYYGCHYGNCTTGTNLPIQVSAINCALTNWTVTTTNSGVWDAAYDIWFCKGGAGSCTGGYDGAELMIWVDYLGASPLGSQIATNVSIAGHNWNVWEGTITSTTTWNVISYAAVTKFDTVSNMDIKSFINDAVSRGYMQTSWYLHAVEAGIEISKPGVPFTSSNFSVTVNSGCGTPIPTATPTPTQCVAVFNGCNSAAQNGTWAGGNATRTFITSGYPAGSLTEGTGLMKVAAGATTNAWNNGLFNLSGFSPDPLTGKLQLTLDIYVDAGVTALWGSYHSLSLVADSTANSLYSVAISSSNPTLNFGEQTVTFALDYPSTITPAMLLSNLYFVLNAQNPVTAGNFYVDNIKLLTSCGLPTVTPTPTRTATPCASLFNGCETLTDNGTWDGTNATRTIVTSATGAPAGMPSQGTGCMRAQVTTPSGYNTGLFNLSGFTPTDFYGTTRISMDLYADAAMISGTYNQMLLFADSGPSSIYFQGISSTTPSVVAGKQTLTWTIDFQIPGGGASSITSGMPITKLNFVYNTGVTTAVGNFYVDNIQLLHDGCVITHTPVPTPTFTRTPTSTATPTSTLPPTATRTPTATPSNSPTRTPSATPTNTTGANTSTATNSPTNSPTRTPSNSPTNSPVNTATNTFTRTATSTPTNSITNTPPAITFTFTTTATRTSTNSPTNSPSSTATNTITNTPAAPTNTFTSSATKTPTNTASNTPSNSPTRTSTSTPTNTLSIPTNTPSSTFTRTATNSPTASPTNSSTPTLPNTPTRTATATSTNSLTNTATNTPSRTPTSTATNSPTQTISYTPTNTFTGTQPPTNTATNSPTKTPTPTFTNSFTNTATSTSTNSPSRTPSSSPTRTPTASLTNTFTTSATPTPTSTSASTLTATNSPTNSPANTRTNTPSTTPTNSPQNTSTSTATLTFTGTTPPTNTATNSPSNTPSRTPSNSPTQTSTATFTNSATRTATPTITSTFTQTATGTLPPTNTATNTPTNSATRTATNSPTATFTSTNTPVFTLTPTATSVTVILTNGSSAPGNSTQLPGTASVPVLQFQLTNMDSAPLTLSSLTLTASGSGNDGTGIALVSLYWDSNGNGLLDASDTLLTTAGYPGNNGSAVLNLNSDLPASVSRSYLVVYDFSASAVGTFQAAIATNLSLSGSNGTGAVNFNGAPLSGAVITIANATATATNTPTSTVSPVNTNTPALTNTFTLTRTNTPIPTNTPTFTSTSTITPTVTPVNTATRTSTPGPQKSPTPVIYPNPAPGPTVKILPPPYNGNSDITVKIFTTAFRKVQETSFPQVPNGTAVPINLTDKWGSPLASGIYYVAVTVDGNRSVGKLLIIH